MEVIVHLQAGLRTFRRWTITRQNVEHSREALTRTAYSAERRAATLRQTRYDNSSLQKQIILDFSSSQYFQLKVKNISQRRAC